MKEAAIADIGPPVSWALLCMPSCSGAEGQPERAGHKAWAGICPKGGADIWANRRKRRDAKLQGLKRGMRQASLAAEEISKPLETVGRKARGLRCHGVLS